MRHSTSAEVQPSRCPGDADAPRGHAAGSVLGVPNTNVFATLAAAPGRVTGQLGKLLVQVRGCKYIYIFWD